MSTNPFSLKLIYVDDIQRLTVISSLTLAQLRTLITNVYSVKDEFNISYFAPNRQLIALETDLQLRQICQSARAMGLVVTLVINRSLNSKNPIVVHENIRCNCCGIYSIIGIRYKCVVCHNYNICSACEALSPVPHQADHPLLKLRSSLPVAYEPIHVISSSILQCTNEASKILANPCENVKAVLNSAPVVAAKEQVENVLNSAPVTQAKEQVQAVLNSAPVTQAKEQVQAVLNSPPVMAAMVQVQAVLNNPSVTAAREQVNAVLSNTSVASVRQHVQTVLPVLQSNLICAKDTAVEQIEGIIEKASEQFSKMTVGHSSNTRYPDALRQLQALGLEDRELLIQLLEQNEGDVQSCLDNLFD